MNPNPAQQNVFRYSVGSGQQPVFGNGTGQPQVVQNGIGGGASQPRPPTAVGSAAVQFSFALPASGSVSVVQTAAAQPGRNIKELQSRMEKHLQAKFHANVAKGLLTLLENPEGTFADFRIISSEGQEFHVHKCILLARSLVFQTMLTCGLKETQTGVIEMKDHSSKVVKFLLRFMYTCEVLPFSSNPALMSKEDSEELCISELVDVATKYQVQDLIEYFDVIIGDFLCTEENALFLLKLVNKYNLKKSQKKVSEFVINRPLLNNAVLSQY